MGNENMRVQCVQLKLNCLLSPLGRHCSFLSHINTIFLPSSPRSEGCEISPVAMQKSEDKQAANEIKYGLTGKIV